MTMQTPIPKNIIKVAASSSYTFPSWSQYASAGPAMTSFAMPLVWQSIARLWHAGIQPKAAQ